MTERATTSADKRPLALVVRPVVHCRNWNRMSKKTQAAVAKMVTLAAAAVEKGVL